ncbi:unnamed protein product [Cyclocybe aegerita]|uniref:C-CAP/cofactor C-like domain-containing protein n=1 Tax=Cyclocybe aegerita TaxID=1973307 RepID=A0A8S0WBI2_CYCAE|nr:unnamed protein product [Cyclocybe aegerita]
MAEAIWTFSQSFTEHFQQLRSELESRVETARAGPPPSQGVLNELSMSLAKATKALADATRSIPSYDQKQSEIQLKALEKSIEALRASSAPKSKFAFKRKVASPPHLPSTAPTIAEASKAVETTNLTPSTHPTLSFHSRELLIRSSLPDHPQQTDLSIFDLDHCIVDLLTIDSEYASKEELSISALHVRNLSHCILLLPPIDGSALLHDISHCTIVLGCHQFRMHTSQKIDVLLSISSNPIIEDCNGIRFGQYPATLLRREKDLTSYSVQDFSHIRSTPSPHFSLLTQDGQVEVEKKVSSARTIDALNELKTIVPQ